MDINLWHWRCAHHSHAMITKLKQGDLVIGLVVSSKSQPDPICEACLAGKMTSGPFPSSDSISEHPLELVHSDLHGPLPVATAEGYRYWMTFIDDCTKLQAVMYLRRKSDTFEAFKTFKAYAENQLNAKIKAVQDDKAGEYMSAAFHKFMDQCGIARRHSTRNRALAPLSDVFEPCAPEARPGQRLLDLYPDHVGFHHRRDFPKAETPPPSPGGSDVAARMMWLHDHVVEGASSPVSHLDEWREKALSERHTMVGITSCSVPADKQFQSTCGWALQHGQTEWIHRTVARQVSHTRCGAHCHPLCSRGRPPIGGRHAHCHLHIAIVLGQARM